jgi:hypothetical protein
MLTEQTAVLLLIMVKPLPSEDAFAKDGVQDGAAGGGQCRGRRAFATAEPGGQPRGRWRAKLHVAES